MYYDYYGTEILQFHIYLTSVKEILHFEISAEPDMPVQEEPPAPETPPVEFIAPNYTMPGMLSSYRGFDLTRLVYAFFLFSLSLFFLLKSHFCQKTDELNLCVPGKGGLFDIHIDEIWSIF